MEFASNQDSGKVQTRLQLKRDIKIAFIGTDCEVSCLQAELQDQLDQELNLVGVFDKIDSGADLKNAEDFLSQKKPFYNHFNGSDKFDRDLSVEEPPENGTRWLEADNGDSDTVQEHQVFDSLENFEKCLAECEVDFLVFSEAHNYPSKIYEFLQSEEEAGLNVLPFAEFFRAISNKEPLVNFSNHSFLYDFEFPESTFTQKWWRRLLDIGVSAAGITILAPFWFLIAAAIKLTSPGPVIYKQKRIGENGEEFTLYKFRTMYQDAEEEGPQWSGENDDRVTPIGRFLRATRLDETPQFINVLKDDMRLIGPRPERPEFVEKLRKKVPFYDHRHQVQPGLTGWAQIHYGYGSSVEDAMVKLQYDLYGIKHRSIAMDIKILWNTFLVVTGLKDTKKETESN